MIFRRKGKDQPAEETTATQDAAGTEEAATGEASGNGPFDAADVDAAPLEAPDRINLGSLVLVGIEGMELQLQVDEQTNEVQAVLVVVGDSALELRAFAAPKTSGIWSDVCREIAAEATRMGGTATEVDGSFGTELRIVVPVQGPDGHMYSQTSRVIGVDGPRWLLRGTLLGRAAIEPDAAAKLEEAFRKVVVVRGNEAMAPREPLALTLPPGAQPGRPEEA
ncbi:MAG TPA: DUF3710 domain-containing protein [Kribbellaceae bacterium]|nr:DUF3710 domain-containing protein [Kribbellaceae bacterium]